MTNKDKTNKVCVECDGKNYNYCRTQVDKQPSINWRAYHAAKEAGELPGNMCQACVVLVEEAAPWDWEWEIPDAAATVLSTWQRVITDRKVVVIAISRRMTDAEAHPATGDEGGKGDETE